jgi:hypothetical protein
MGVIDRTVGWDTFDTDIEKILEKEFPGADMHMKSETMTGDMGGGKYEHVATYEGTYKGKFTRIVFSSKKEEGA